MSEEKKGYIDLIIEWIVTLVKSWFGERPQEIKPEPVPDPDKPVVAYPSPPLEFPFLERALIITGNFEGTGYDQVTGDFDGQGVSAGILQWNYGQGSLQAMILRPFVKLHGSIDLLFDFPEPGIDASVKMGPSDALLYVRKHMIEPGVSKRLKREWANAWRAFMSHSEVIELQIEAAKAVARRANGLMEQWGMSSQRAFCFFFDVVTQNGSMSSVIKLEPDRDVCRRYAEVATSQNKNLWLPLIEKASDEQLTLFRAAYMRAQLSRPAYFQDVFARKGTIALGRGYVHGESWDLIFTEP